MAHDDGRPLAEGLHDGDAVLDQLDHAVGLHRLGPGGPPVAAHVHGHGTVAGRGEGGELVAPGVPGLREAVHEQDQGALALFDQMGPPGGRGHQAVDGCSGGGGEGHEVSRGIGGTVRVTVRTGYAGPILRHRRQPGRRALPFRQKRRPGYGCITDRAGTTVPPLLGGPPPCGDVRT